MVWIVDYKTGKYFQTDDENVIKENAEGLQEIKRESC